MLMLMVLLVSCSSFDCLLDAEDYDRHFKLFDEDADDSDTIGGPTAGKQTCEIDAISLETDDIIDLPMDVNSGCFCRQYNSKYCVSCFDPYQCVNFPREVRMAYNTLRLCTTKIRALHADDLGFRNTHLETLIIASNMEFSSIKPGAFNNMSNLKYIGIFLNTKLKYLETNSFQGCDSLRVLILRGNGFIRMSDITKALQPSIVPQLKLLKVENAKIQNLTRADFDVMTNTNLYSMKLSGCDVTYLDPKILIPLQKLKVLHIGENRLTQKNILDLLDEIVASNSSLHSIDLCKFQHLPTQILKEVTKTNISKLYFSNCNTEFFMIEVFPEMPKIKLLNLSGVMASNVAQNAFNNLVNLETLILSQNKLGGIPAAVILPKLINLDMSDNTVSDKTKFLLEGNTFANMQNLRNLNISQNNVGRIFADSFLGLTNLEVLDLENTKLIAADEYSFSSLKSLKYLNLRKNAFPGRMMSPDIYNGLKNLKVLILTECGIQTIKEHQNIFLKMPRLESLRLDSNMMGKIFPYIFEPLTNLKHVDISSNFLKVWDFKLFPNNKVLQNLVSQDNVFRTITPAMVDDISRLQKLDLRNNKFTCTCDHFKNVSNLVSTEVLNLLDNQPPICLFPDDYLNTSISSYLREVNSTKVCEIVDIVEKSVSILIGLASTLLVIIISGLILLYIYRWHVKYWLFLAKMAVNGSGGFFKNKFNTKRSYSYDAFVSYCNEDREFVNHLISMLENQEPFLKLCVYERDFQIGTVISESVLESVADSRRTLLVISDAYIRSQWCRWEVQVAENHRLFFEDENGKCVNDTLVMVKLGDINTSTIVSPMLRYLMKTRIYLEWDTDVVKQAAFWRKLRRALNPSNKISKLT